jgi:hypothetical protein
MTVVDFASAKARRDGRVRERTAAVERYATASRPYASFDDLPDVTIIGAELIKEHVLCGTRT